jgi:hypothetical protein
MYEEYCEMGMTWAAVITKKIITITNCILFSIIMTSHNGNVSGLHASWPTEWSYSDMIAEQQPIHRKKH